MSTGLFTLQFCEEVLSISCTLECSSLSSVPTLYHKFPKNAIDNSAKEHNHFLSNPPKFEGFQQKYLQPHSSCAIIIMLCVFWCNWPNRQQKFIKERQYTFSPKIPPNFIHRSFDKNEVVHNLLYISGKIRDIILKIIYTLPFCGMVNNNQEENPLWKRYLNT